VFTYQSILLRNHLHIWLFRKNVFDDIYKYSQYIHSENNEYLEEKREELNYHINKKTVAYTKLY